MKGGRNRRDRGGGLEMTPNTSVLSLSEAIT